MHYERGKRKRFLRWGLSHCPQAGNEFPHHGDLWNRDPQADRLRHGPQTTLVTLAETLRPREWNQKHQSALLQATFLLNYCRCEPKHSRFHRATRSRYQARKRCCRYQQIRPFPEYPRNCRHPHRWCHLGNPGLRIQDVECHHRSKCPRPVHQGTVHFRLSR